MSGQCGTTAGYQAHQRAGEPTCAPCRKAIREYMRAYRHRTGRNTRTLTPDNILAKHGIKVTK